MSAVSAIETLRAVGAEAISAQTHISADNISRLLAGDFEAFSSVQFNGFVTIIEREYDVDMSQWRARFAESVPQPEVPLAETENDPFTHAVIAKKKQRLTVAILAGMLFLVVLATYFVLGSDGAEEKIELNNTAIEQAKANMATLGNRTVSEMQMQVDAIQEGRQIDGAESEETNETQSVNVNVEKTEPDPVVPALQPVSSGKFTIVPKTNVWLGVIDIQSHRRETKTTGEPWELDGSKAWLVVSGHGYLTLECGDGNLTYTQTSQMLFLYENGRCREIDEAEFRSLNRGRVW